MATINMLCGFFTILLFYHCYMCATFIHHSGLAEMTSGEMISGQYSAE